MIDKCFDLWCHQTSLTVATVWSVNGNVTTCTINTTSTGDTIAATIRNKYLSDKYFCKQIIH